MSTHSTLIIAEKDELRQCIRQEVDTALQGAVEQFARLARQKEFLTNDDLAELTGLSARTLAYHRKKGALPYFKRGRRILYDATEVYNWITESRVQSPDRPAIRKGSFRLAEGVNHVN